MKVKIPYGRNYLEIALDEEVKADVIKPKWVDGLPDPCKELHKALKDPHGCSPLRVLAAESRHIGIVFSDITRATPYHQILPPLLDELDQVPDERITFFCATGTHRHASEKELTTILGHEVVKRFRIVQNDASDSKTFTRLGPTSSGNVIFVNSELCACDLKILTGFIEPHFFMGFSGGGKAVIPGMASMESIRYNHSLKLLKDSRATWGITEGNPLWEDVHEAAEKLDGLFLLNITLNSEKAITGVFVGDLRKAHARGVAFARAASMVKVDKPYDLVVTGNSGYPLDLNIYQSIKGISAASQIIRPGGLILMAAHCWDGIPADSDYERILGLVRDPSLLEDFLIQNEDRFGDTWQVYLQARVQQKAKVMFYSDQLDEATIREVHFEPIRNIEASIHGIIEELGPDARICILPEGPQTIPYL